MKVLLLILDGWGFSFQERGNAIAQAKLPTMEYIESHYPSCLLKSSGISAGLPWVEPGNSEVGHLTLGAGRITLQAMPRIIEAMRDGSFFKNEAFLKAVEHTKTHNSQLHLMGLIGSGSVHSYIDHLYGLLELAAKEGISSKVKLHLFMDGNDSPPREGIKMLQHLNLRLEQTGQGEIATIIGREYAMDRDYNWAKTQATFELMVQGKGNHVFDEAQTMQGYYRQGLEDSSIPPTVIVQKDSVPKGLLQENDSIIFFNYREDSARQLTKAFILPEKVGFQPEVPNNLLFVSMTEYEKGFPCEVAFKPILLQKTLADVLAEHGKAQFHIAETHKYAHVTYFFNGMNEEKHPGEEWQLIPSVDSANFISKPELKTPDIAEATKKVLEKNEYDFILINFANADVLSHTGNFAATVQGCEVIDRCVKELLDTIHDSPELASQWTLVITADHGHAETMLDLIAGTALTEHTSNDAPLYLIAPRFKKDITPLEIFSRKKKTAGILADVAPTILELMSVPQPVEMTGKSLVSELISPQ